MTDGERAQEWVRCLKNCDTYNSRAATLKFIHDKEPKMLSAVLKHMNLHSANDVVKWLAE